jgi:hypothetical protein
METVAAIVVATAIVALVFLGIALLMGTIAFICLSSERRRPAGVVSIQGTLVSCRDPSVYRDDLRPASAPRLLSRAAGPVDALRPPDAPKGVGLPSPILGQQRHDAAEFPAY